MEKSEGNVYGMLATMKRLNIFGRDSDVFSIKARVVLIAKIHGSFLMLLFYSIILLLNVQL